MGYTKEAVKGISWVGAGRVVTRGLALIRIPILARLLSPSQFGVFGIAGLILAFVEILAETGINVFLIQERKDIDRYINTAWVISILRGVLVGFIIFLATPFVVSFFSATDAKPLLLLISLVPVIRGFINPSIVKFQRELAFDREFRFKSAILLVESAVGVVLAFLTRDPVSLVWALIASAGVEVLVSFLVVKPTPRFIFEGGLARKIFTRGKWVTVYGILNYIFEHGGDIAVAKLVGVFPLGLYRKAYELSTLPITEVTQVVGRVTFPVYTKIAGEKSRLARAFLQTTGAISALTIPFGLLIFFYPEFIISILLGPAWLGAVAALKVLAIFGVVRAIANSVFILFLSVNKQEWVSTSTLVATAVLMVSVIPLTNTLGIVGAGLAALAGQLLTIPIIIYYAFRILRWAR